MRKLLMFILLGMFLINFVSAGCIAPQCIGTFKLGDCVSLPQDCADCTYNYISYVSYPNSSQALGETIMTKTGTHYNYDFCNTTLFGEYHVSGHGDEYGIDTVWGGDNYYFEITPNGQDFSTGKAISYIGFILIILFTFLLTLYGAIKMEWKHKRNDENKIISINNFRYIKVFLFSMNYMLMMFIFGLSYKFFSEANIQGFTNFFFYGYQLFEKLLIPIMITMVIIFFIIFITNIKIKDKLKLGIH